MVRRSKKGGIRRKNKAGTKRLPSEEKRRRADERKLQSRKNQLPKKIQIIQNKIGRLKTQITNKKKQIETKRVNIKKQEDNLGQFLKQIDILEKRFQEDEASLAELKDEAKRILSKKSTLTKKKSSKDKPKPLFLPSRLVSKKAKSAPSIIQKEEFIKPLSKKKLHLIKRRHLLNQFYLLNLN